MPGYMLVINAEILHIFNMLNRSIKAVFSLLFINKDIISSKARKALSV